MATEKLIERESEEVAINNFSVAVPASGAATLSSWVDAVKDSVQLLVESDPTALIESADQLVAVARRRITPNHSLIAERFARFRTVEGIVASTEWLSSEQINQFQRSPPANKSFPATDWKRRGNVFSVEWDGDVLYAGYQFDLACQPLPVIKKILLALGTIADPWVIAAWFHFPNGWLSDTNGRPVAPKDALDRPVEELEMAAKMRLNSYVA